MLKNKCWITKCWKTKCWTKNDEKMSNNRMSKNYRKWTFIRQALDDGLLVLGYVRLYYIGKGSA
jgi:hypothetical protein